MLNKSFVVFNVSIVLFKFYNQKSRIVLKLNKTKTNQNSNLVIINIKLIKKLNLKFKNSKKLDNEKMKITIINEHNHRLNY